MKETSTVSGDSGTPAGSLRKCLLRLEGFLQHNCIDRFTPKTFYLVVWALMTLAWMPAYLALFPGTYGYDVPLQVSQYYKFGGYTLSLHHPPIHTLLIGLFLSLGGSVGSYQLGYALFTLFQLLMVTSVMARMLCFLRSKKMPALFLTVSFLWLVCNPLLQALSLNGTKDILFGVFLLHFGLDYRKLLTADRSSATGIRRFIDLPLILFGLLMCLFRNQGVYIVLALILLLLLFSRRSKALLLSLAVVLVLAEGFQFFFANVLNLEKGDKREMLSIPMQQVAYVGHLYLEDPASYPLTQEQVADLDTLIPNRAVILDFEETSADMVKAYFQTDLFFEDLPHYMKTYFQIGLSYPGAYLKELHNMLWPYFFSYSNEYTGLVTLWTFTDYNPCELHFDPIIGFYALFLIWCCNHPFFICSSLSIWALILLTLAALLGKKKKSTLYLMPFFLYMLTMLLGPVALLRYLYPLMLGFPLFFGIFCDN